MGRVARLLEKVGAPMTGWQDDYDDEAQPRPLDDEYGDKAARLMAAVVFGCIGLVLIALTVRLVIWILV
jgi:hypothetical protein